MKHKVVILGSGSAGLTAAIYTARAALEPIVIAGREAGGQLMLTSDVENYPGFPEGILGPELMDRMRRQAERFGAQFIDEDATGVDFSRPPFKVITETSEFEAESVIAATGASARWLGLPSEQQFIGRGVSSCATCDGFFFRGKELAVVGGGDTAMEEATFLTKFATKVTVIHRRDQLRASKIMENRAFANDKIDLKWDTVVTNILGNHTVDGLALENVKTQAESELAVSGLFMAIGYNPNTHIFRGQLDLNQAGYINARDEVFTNVEGVFVAGDVEDYRYRQAVTAAGAGCKAALEVESYLAAHE